MKKSLTSIFAVVLLGSLPAVAMDCGEPPMDHPPVPTGTGTSTTQIRDARDAVISFSKKVDEYLTCMDQRAPEIMPYLTKEQKARWDEDLAALHEERRQLQIKMNEAIRTFRRTNNG